MSAPSSIIVRAAILIAMVCSTVQAQCRPDIYEVGGVPSAIAFGGGGFEAVSRGRIVQIMSTAGGQGAVVGTVALNSRVRHMHSEVAGRICAIDNDTLYIIECTVATNPQVLGSLRLSPIANNFLRRVRIHGNFAYVLTGFGQMFIVDVTNPGAPVLRSTFQGENVPILTDIEVVGSYAYASIKDAYPGNSAYMVIDITDPGHPMEIIRFGTGQGLRITYVPGNPYLYLLNRDSGSNGHIQRLSLSSPQIPVVAATSPLVTGLDLDQEELAITPNCVAFMNGGQTIQAGAVTLLDATSLAVLGQTMALPVSVTSMGIDAISLYVGHITGQVDRINIATPLNPSVTQAYLSVYPGETLSVAAAGNGFSILTHTRGTWFFRSQGGPPQLVSFVRTPADSYSVGGTIVPYNDVVYITEFDSATATTYVRAYRLAISPTSSVTLIGSFAQSGLINGFDVGFVSGATYLFYCTSASNGSNPVLHTLNVTNPAAMTHAASFSLTLGVTAPVKFLPDSIIEGQPARIAIGGGIKTQIVLASNPLAIGPLGVIPDGALNGLRPGPGLSLWLVDSRARLHVYGISTPSAPALLSTLQLPPESHDFKFIDPFANQAACISPDGWFTRISAGSPVAPSIMQIAHLADTINGVAFDGAQILLAEGGEGFKVLPQSFNSAPAEDPGAPISGLGKQGYLPICPGAPVTIQSHFVAIPAVSSWQWYRLNMSTYALDPVVNGPTGTGSVMSGATSATLTISDPGAADATGYLCRATNSCGTSPDSTSIYTRLGGYANCDQSTVSPVLNVNDFQCFLNQFAAGDDHANCDESTTPPILNVNDFQCYVNEFATTCHS